MDQEVSAEVGRDFHIELEAMPGAGYLWTVDLTGAQEVLTPLGIETVARSSLAGSPAIQRFSFRPVRPGTVDLRFSCGHPWEDAPIRERRIVVKAEPRPT